MGKLSGLILALLLLVLLSGCGEREPVDVWEFMDGDLSRLPRFSETRSVRFSSYDRTGGNDDGFSGLSSRIRIDQRGEHVLAEMNGPGCVKRIWMTWPGRSVNIRIYIDGAEEPLFNLPIDRLFSGRLPPFVAPWVGGDKQFSGINFSYIPIPFEKNIRITTTGGIHFYQIDAHRYPNGSKVNSFRLPFPEEERERLTRSRDALARLSSDVSIDMPWTVAVDESDESFRSAFTVAPGENGTIFESERPGEIVDLRLSCDDDRASLRRTVLLAWWDGEEEPSVRVPLADLFGSAFQPGTVRSAALIVSENRALIRWPMPFTSAKLAIRNTGEKPVACETAFLLRKAEDLDRKGRFHAQWNRTDAWDGKPVSIAKLSGRGHYVGTLFSALAARTGSFLEGDETIIADADTAGAIRGTGTEDYFNSGWYFAHEASGLPFHGTVFKREDPAPRLSVFRHHLTDRISFGKSFLFDLEHGEGNNAGGTSYSIVAVWYQEEPHLAGKPSSFEESIPERRVVLPPHTQKLVTGYFSWGDLAGGWAGLPGESVLPMFGGGERRASFSIPVHIPASGRYDFHLVFARGPGLGSFRASLDGADLFGVVECGGDSIEPVVLTEPARLSLKQGDRRLTIEAVGSARALSSREEIGWARTDWDAGEMLAVINGALVRPSSPFVERWFVTGPFDGSGEGRFHYPYPPEVEYLEGKLRPHDSEYTTDLDPRVYSWKSVHADSTGFVDLRKAIGPGNHRIAYASTRCTSSRARRVLFSVGTDDGGTVWLNGEEIWSREVRRGWEDDQERFTGEFKEGVNEILVKVSQGIGGWGFSMRVCRDWCRDPGIP